VSDILILARVRIPGSDLSVMADYYFDVSRRLEEVDGFKGLSVWRAPNDPDAFLVAYDYAHQEAVEAGLMAVTEVRAKVQSDITVLTPADVLRVRVVHRTQIGLHEAPASSFLSMSTLIADPGYSPELVDDLDQTFGELQLLPGYVGSMIGINDALEEEVIGLVTWSSEASFQTSLPPGKKIRQVQLYSRFF
jgi:heme-degrading monooxygenase HmoA